ncbi:hypothetical protein J2858_004518 [Neorhizobium galegae]|uniref:hypothetical protein n=1 Tax=Neorhizobium galegae TaxID=399 RepID=UPI001AE44DF4|nr:hypothetical protein [Neorhizobium galegae]MBP2551576.1 hypothetical protein [Neorhizobium galegae]
MSTEKPRRPSALTSATGVPRDRHSVRQVGRSPLTEAGKGNASLANAEGAGLFDHRADLGCVGGNGSKGEIHHCRSDSRDVEEVAEEALVE